MESHIICHWNLSKGAPLEWAGNQYIFLGFIFKSLIKYHSEDSAYISLPFFLICYSFSELLNQMVENESISARYPTHLIHLLFLLSNAPILSIHDKNVQTLNTDIALNPE